VPNLERSRAQGASPPSIFEFAGGWDAFLALAAAHHERCLADPELSHAFRGELNPQHVENLAAYWAEVFGGPPSYSESHGGHSAMLEIHARQGVGDDFASRFVACFMQAADDAGLPDDPEFRSAIREYMEWAVGEVESYGSPDAHVAPGLTMPRWSWDGPVQVS
jgi:hemoglobin